MTTEEYRLERLPNGQRLITEKLDHLRSVCLGFWIPAGSRDEPAPLVGTTHFIEHLLFKGRRSTRPKRSLRSSTPWAGS